MLLKSLSLSLLLLLPLTLAAQRVEYHHFGTIYPVDGTAQWRMYQRTEDGTQPLPLGGEIKIIDEGEGIDLADFYPLAVYPIKESVKQPVPFEGAPEWEVFVREEYFGSVKDASIAGLPEFGKGPFDDAVGLLLWVKDGKVLKVHQNWITVWQGELRRGNVEFSLDEYADGFPVFALVKDSRLISRKENSIPDAIVAAALGDLERLKVMRKDQLKVRDSMGNSPLHRAAINGHLAVVQHLLDQGLKIDDVNEEGQTPAMLAAVACRLDVLQLLVDANPKTLLKRDKNGQGVLHLAVGSGSPEAVAYLLSSHPKRLRIDEANKVGWSPIDWALNTCNDATYALLRDSSNKVVRLEDRIPNFEDAILFATAGGATEIVKDLLKTAAVLNGPRNHSYVVAAATGGTREIMDLFLDAGLSVEQKGSEGVTPLMAAVAARRPDAVRYLIEKGADVEAASRKGATALMYAVHYNEPGIVGILLEAGANPSKGVSESLPLDLAINAENESIIEMLLLAGAICSMDPLNADQMVEKAIRNDVPAIVRTALESCLEADHLLYGKYPLLWTMEFFGATACLEEFASLPAMDGPELARPKDLDSPPQALIINLPAYPRELQGKGDFSVKVRMLIDEAGHVRLPEIIDSPHPDVGHLLLMKTTEWRFFPAAKDGKPAHTTVVLPISFQEPAESREVREFAELSRPPRPIHQVIPGYPIAAHRRNLSGNVLAEFVVDRQGHVTNIQIIHSTHYLFSYSVVRALEQWKFEPGLIDGQPVNTRVRVPIPFSVRR